MRSMAAAMVLLATVSAAAQRPSTASPKGQEIIARDGDRIILDDDSLTSLQAKLARLAPATIYSRALAAKKPLVAA